MCLSRAFLEIDARQSPAGPCCAAPPPCMQVLEAIHAPDTHEPMAVKSRWSALVLLELAWSRVGRRATASARSERRLRPPWRVLRVNQPVRRYSPRLYDPQSHRTTRPLPALTSLSRLPHRFAARGESPASRLLARRCRGPRPLPGSVGVACSSTSTSASTSRLLPRRLENQRFGRRASASYLPPLLLCIDRPSRPLCVATLQVRRPRFLASPASPSVGRRVDATKCPKNQFVPRPAWANIVRSAALLRIDCVWPSARIGDSFCHTVGHWYHARPSCVPRRRVAQPLGLVSKSASMAVLPGQGLTLRPALDFFCSRQHRPYLKTRQFLSF